MFRHYVLVVLTLYLVTKAAKGCEEDTRCTTAAGQPGTCHQSVCHKHANTEIRTNLSIDIVVKYPESTLKANGGQHLYIRGSGVGLSWSKGVEMTKTGTNTWRYTVNYASSITGFQCGTCINKAYLVDNKLQYRVFVDDKRDMLGANFAIQFPVSADSSYFETKPEFMIYPWFFTTTGVERNLTVTSDFIGGNRSVYLYTPPSFHENVYKTYPGMYLFDHEMISPKYILEGPIYPHAISEEYVILGFSDYGPMDNNRTDLLSPVPGQWWDCINGTFNDLCDNCIPRHALTNGTLFMWYLNNVCGVSLTVGGKGDDTLNFLLKEFLPVSLNVTNNRIRKSELGIMGYSLGGLMACYAAWTRPRDFKMAACQSPSFWWPTSANDTSKNEFHFLTEVLTDPSLSVNRPADQGIYIDAGSEEEDPKHRLTSSAVEAALNITKHDNYKLNRNVWIHVAPGMIHSPVSFNLRFWQAIQALLPGTGDPHMPKVSDSVISGATPFRLALATYTTSLILAFTLR